jgi:Ala-tRNA(Pro) deacylase
MSDLIFGTTSNTYEMIIHLLQQNKIQFRIIDHPPEGNTERASKIRGHNLSQAAKSMVVMVRISKKYRNYYLAVIPGDRKVDLCAVNTLCGGRKTLLAPLEIAEKITNCITGSISPFSFHEELRIIVDPLLLNNQEIVFNAGRLDKSIILDTDSYLCVAKPLIIQTIT